MTGERAEADHTQSNNIFVVEKDHVILSTENIGYTGPLVPLLAGLLIDEEVKQSYITGINLYQYLAEINEKLQLVWPGWRMRITAKNRHALNGKIIRGRFFIDYIAIKHQLSRTSMTTSRIDVINLDLLYDKPPKSPVLQLEAALAIIHLQQSRGLNKMRFSRGTIGTALIKASPDWKKDRYAAPKLANEIGREHLPGNFYSISPLTRRKPNNTGSFSLKHCYYLDQDSSHHNIVLTTKIPHPQSIRARGHFRAALEKRNRYPVWAKDGDDIFQSIMAQEHIGLVLAKIYISTLPPTKIHLYPPWMQKRGEKYVWLWTPELRLINNDHRIQLDSFVAGFTGYSFDPVLPEYAKWSLNYIKENERTRNYTKTILLSAYGMLAFNSDNYRKIYRYWGGKISGNKKSLPCAGQVIERVISLPKDRQHTICNTIARGIIEAETRTRSLEYAKQLDSCGIHIPQIYVDGILVETDQLPFIRDGWRISHSLNNVFIPRSNAMISDELIKLPGIPHTEDDLKFMQKYEEARKPLTVASRSGIII